MGRRVVSLLSAVMCLLAVALVPSWSPVSAASDEAYVGLTPERIMDTRESSPIGPGGVKHLKVAGVGGVPADGVGAVALNVTVTGSSAPTFVTVFPAGAERPTASNVNIAAAGDTVANSVVAQVGEAGEVSIYNGVGNAHVIVDVAGWFPDDGEFSGLVPDRILDTRDGSAIAAAGARDLKVTGVGGVPADGVGAVVLNVTATEAVGPTFVTVFPTGAERPTASNVNVSAAGDTVANLVIATVGDDGSVSIANGPNGTDVIVDVAGWFPDGGAYSGLVPERIMDTRDGSALGRNGVRTLGVTGVGGVPADGVGAVVLNVTATEAVGPTFVTVFPTGAERPTASNVNVSAAGDTVANLVIATVGDDGSVSIANGPNGTDIIVDVAGWFPGEATPDPDPDPDPDPEPESGTVYAAGNSTLWRYELGSGEPRWTDLDFRRDEFGIAHDTHELVVAEHELSNDYRVRVDISDLDTFAEVEHFIWPGSAWGDVIDVDGSDDGQLIALLGEDGDYNHWLEVIDRTTHDVQLVLDESFGKIEAFAWAPNGDIILVTTYEGIDGIPDGTSKLLRVGADGFGQNPPPVEALYEFSPADGAPYDPAVSRDGERVVFGRAKQIWTASLQPASAPKLIASAPEQLEGAYFSPDGSELVLNRYSVASGYQAQYIIPSTPAEPIVLDDERGEPYMLVQDNLIRRIVDWR